MRPGSRAPWAQCLLPRGDLSRGAGGPHLADPSQQRPPPHFLVLEFAYREFSPEQSRSSDLAVDEGLLVPQTRRLLDVVPGTAWVCLSGSGFPVPQT